MLRSIVFYLTFFLTVHSLYGQQILFFEDFNQCALSDQWTVKIEGNQNAAWSVGIPENPKADSLSINGSCMLVIDDDLTGDKTDSFNIRFTSAYFDGSDFSDIDFKAQVHFRRDQQEYLRILIDNGKKEHLIREFKNRNYSGDKFTDYVDISADLSFIASDSMRIIIEYDDANAWGWWAGLDNISVTGSKDGKIVMGENFNDCNLPQGWTTEILNGVDDWNFGIFNDGRTIDGSCFVYFNDDILGETAPLSKIRIYGPTFNATEFSNYKLTYDLIYRTYEANEYLQLYVDNGKEWIPVKIYTSDFGGPEVDKSQQDSIDLSPFRGEEIRLIWEHNDGGWAWWVGFDNVKVTGKGSINDRCDKATTLVMDGDCLVFDNTNALNTDDLDPTNSDPAIGYLYYTWKSSSNADFKILTQSSFNDQIEIFEGSCAQALKIKSINRDEYGFEGEEIVLKAEAEKDYIIRLSGKAAEFGLQKGNGCIYLVSNPAIIAQPDSDLCLEAKPILKNQPCVNAQNKLADFDGPIPTKNIRSRADIWYAFTPQDTNAFDFKSNTDFADALAVYKGSCDQLVEVASEYSGQKIAIKNVEIGQNYYFQVSGYFSILEGNVCGQIIEQQSPIISNDDCVASLPVMLNNQCTASINTGAEYSGVRPSCDYTVLSDVWFSFVAPSSNNVFIRANVDFEHILSVYEGTCNDLTSIYCNKNPHFCNGFLHLDNVVAGKTYYIQVGSKIIQSGAQTGNICIEILDQEPMCKPISFDVIQECISKGAVLLTPINLDTLVHITFDGIGMDQPVLGGERYVIEGKDDDGCVFTKVIDTQTCNDFGCTIAATLEQTNASCYGLNNGMASFEVEGGLEPYEIRWSNGVIGSVVTSLAAGSYQVTISDGSACELIQQVVINQPAEILTNPSYKQPLCFGDESGSINLTVIGGISPYQYQWSNGNTTSLISEVSGGNYIITITDSNNCTSSQSFQLSQPEQIIITENITNNPCPGDSLGEISVFIKGGTGSYDIKWLGNESSSKLTNLLAGNYTVEVTDDNGCIAQDTFEVLSPAPINLTVDSIVLEISNADPGYISITMNGGTAPYVYEWQLNGVSIGQNTNMIIVSDAGSYEVLVSDANGCIWNSQVWEVSIINRTENLDKGDRMKLVPNPVVENLQIQFSNLGNIEKWQIMDILGRIVQSNNEVNLIENKLNINIGHLSVGTYFYSCEKNGKRYISKFVKI
jgi:Secretion system C-terminal sorting domain/SprB repeat